MSKQPSLAQLKQDLADIADLNDSRLVLLAADSRKGAQLLLKQIQHRLAKAEAAEQAFQERLHYE
ncbi:MAG: ribonuclease HII, partial [Levilactobacillus brevis]